MDWLNDPKKLNFYVLRRLRPFIFISVIIDLIAAFFSFYLFSVCIFLSFIGIFFEFIFIRRALRIDVVSYIEKLFLDIKDFTDYSMISFPVPVVVIRFDGSIYWYNDYFYNLAVPTVELFGKVLSDVLPTLEFVRLLSKSETRLVFSHNENKYEAFVEAVSSQYSSGESLAIIYFIDRTGEFNLKQAFEDHALVECIVMIDNYDEVVKEITSSNQNVILSDIENKINAWVLQYNGVLCKYERDKYFVIFENICFEEVVKSRFNILDVIRDIELDNKVPVTLSIGVGVGGSDISQRDKFARIALDMALGRGGDQAVVNNSNNFDFYGAKLREFEKRTKVKVRVVAHALKGLIAQSDKVMIMGHKGMDMDSFGACTGLFKIVKGLGKDPYVVLNRHFEMYKNFEHMFKDESRNKNFAISSSEALSTVTDSTLLIVVDTHKPDFVECPDLIGAVHNIVLIDHHRRSADFLNNVALVYHEPYASSTCEMVTEIFQYIESGRLTVEEAEIIYAGIVVDTKNFTTKTGIRTFEAASYLKRVGVDISNVRKLFQDDIDDFIKKAIIESNVEIYRDNIAISQYTTDSKSAQLLAAKAADELLSIKQVLASFVLVETEENVIISGRSLGDINVQVILERLGGGGHMNVAGAQISDMNIEEVMLALYQSVDEFFEDQ